MSYLDEITGKDWDENHDDHSLKSELIEEDTEEMPTEIDETDRNVLKMGNITILDGDEIRRKEEAMQLYPSMTSDKLLF